MDLVNYRRCLKILFYPQSRACPEPDLDSLWRGPRSGLALAMRRAIWFAFVLVGNGMAMQQSSHAASFAAGSDGWRNHVWYRRQGHDWEWSVGQYYTWDVVGSLWSYDLYPSQVCRAPGRTRTKRRPKRNRSSVTELDDDDNAISSCERRQSRQLFRAPRSMPSRKGRAGQLMCRECGQTHVLPVAMFAPPKWLAGGAYGVVCYDLCFNISRSSGGARVECRNEDNAASHVSPARCADWKQKRRPWMRGIVAQARTPSV